MNMQAIMAQAKKMQQNLEKDTKELEGTEFTYNDNNVEIIANGNNSIKKINIKNKDLLTDEEMLEDVLLVAINNVIKQIKNAKDNKLGKYTGGLGGLF